MVGGTGVSMELDAVAAVVVIQSLCDCAKWALLGGSVNVAVPLS